MAEACSWRRGSQYKGEPAPGAFGDPLGGHRTGGVSSGDWEELRPELEAGVRWHGSHPLLNTFLTKLKCLVFRPKHAAYCEAIRALRASGMFFGPSLQLLRGIRAWVGALSSPSLGCRQQASPFCFQTAPRPSFSFLLPLPPSSGSLIRCDLDLSFMPLCCVLLHFEAPSYYKFILLLSPQALSKFSGTQKVNIFRILE